MEISITKPFPFSALPRVWHWIEEFQDKVADDFSPKTLDEFVALMAGKWREMKTWGISADGELGGLITFERFNEWRGTAHVLLKPAFHGKGIAVKACRQAVAEMFSMGVGKLEFSVLARNLAIGSLLTQLGAAREGTLKGHTLVAAQPKDVWQYGLSKVAFEERKS
jgi:RimJ/RimL family protein N-acetyltransferase